MSTHGPARYLLLPVLALVAACGGADPAVRAGGVPIAGVVVGESGPGTPELRAGQLAAARAGFESLVRADPQRMDALNDLAVAYHLEGHSEAARQLLDEVVARGGPREQQAALVNLADLYAAEGFLEAARAHLDAARAIDPARGEAAWAASLLADARGDADAGRLAAEALRLDADGGARRRLVFSTPEEREHLEAVAAEAGGDRALAAARWRSLRDARFPALAQAARRRLAEP